MDEYILEDNLKSDEMRLVKAMLNAVVNYPDAINNSFTVKGVSLRAPIQGYSYFLSAKGSALSPFRNNQILPEDITLVLLNLKLVEPERGHNKSGSWFCFTEAALEWHRQFGGLSADEIRKRIGRILYKDAGWTTVNDYRVDDVANEIGTTPERVTFHTMVLIRAGLVNRRFQGMTDFGTLVLSEPEGILWATGGFQSIGERSSQAVAVTVDLRLEVRAIIEQARSAEIPEATLMEFEARLNRVKEELEKPKGEGRFQRVRELMEFGANSKEVGLLVAQFIASQTDRIADLVDVVSNVMSG